MLVTSVPTKTLLSDLLAEPDRCAPTAKLYFPSCLKWNNDINRFQPISSCATSLREVFVKSLSYLFKLAEYLPSSEMKGINIMGA